MSDDHLNFESVPFDKKIAEDLIESERAKVYEKFGRFVAQFETLTAQIRLCLFELEMLKEAALSKEFEVKAHLVTSGQLINWLKQSYVEMNAKDFIKISEKGDIDELFNASETIIQIRNFLVHGNWTEFYHFFDLNPDNNFLNNQIDTAIYVDKTKQTYSEPESTVYNKIDIDFFERLNSQLIALTTEYKSLVQIIRNDSEQVKTGYEFPAIILKELKRLKEEKL